MANARQTALKLLNKLEGSAGYSNILLDNELSKARLDEREKKFAAALFYGTLERKLTLDKIIEDRLVKKKDKLAAEIRNILMLGIYQLKFMDSVPDHTAVDESVKLVPTGKNPALKGFVNGILRGYVRDGKPMPKGKTRAEGLMYEYSCPLWLVQKWIDEYSEDIAQQMLKASVGRPPVTARVNTIKTTPAKLCEMLEDEGVSCECVKEPEGCIRLSGAAVENTNAFKQGLYHIQDISSQLCAMALDAKEGMTVIDVCSAPGGKSFTVAELMKNSGRLLAFDLHENRVKLIRSSAARLGLDIIEASANDAKVFDEKMPLADRVLCDVPCSGLGVIRRKPEIKYKDPADLERLPDIQLDILRTSSRYVKKCGVLVYSTCTLSRAENDDVIEKFLSENKAFAPDKIGGAFGELAKASITPKTFDSDGFFIAKLRRID